MDGKNAKNRQNRPKKNFIFLLAFICAIYYFMFCGNIFVVVNTEKQTAMAL
jgi:hypothetical protein